MTGVKDALLKVVDDCTQEMIEALQALIRIPTVNPPGEHYIECVEHFDAWLKTLGYETEIVSVPEERLAELSPQGNGSPRPNLLARLSGPGGPGLRVHLNGHYDVVPAANDWTRDPWGGEIADGKIFGRGSSDMKGGLVAQIFAVEALRRAGIQWSGQVTHSIVADEETVGNMNAGTGFLVEQGVIAAGNTDAVIITEPFGLVGIGVGHKGAIWGEFIFHGKQSHGSTPHLGVNAVELLARFLARVETELQPELRTRLVTDIPVAPPEAAMSTMSFDTISGGVATNVVPDRCSVTFNRRFVHSESLEGTRGELLSILEEMQGEDPRIEYEYRETYATEPTLVGDDQPLVQIARRAITEMGRTPTATISAGSHDQRFFVRNAGISNAILYGPGPTNISHQSDEFLAIDDLVQGTKTLALMLYEMLGPEGS
ncbi:acetylornithine deacetylase/succinyl-diaminopimelate desuccinylase family protein [soil metagenome]